MSEQIEAGDGWRLLGPDDVLRHGDEMLFYVDGKAHWTAAPDTCFNEPKAKYFLYRRSIPAKPERLVLKEVAASICHRKKKPETWKVVASIDATFPGTGYVDAAEARKLADWLTRFADWQESQKNQKGN